MPLSASLAARALCIACAMHLAVHAQAARPCARWALVDGLGDPGTLMPTGAAFDVDPGLPPDQNASVLGGVGPTGFLANVAVGDARTIYLSDLEADPSSLGPDPNGNPGHGAIFRLGAAGALVLVADGTLCGASIPTCPPGGVFVDPLGLAYEPRTGMLLVTDVDADPSGLGPDIYGFAGHGAVYRVDPATGIVDLVNDGTAYTGPNPTGDPSIFVDPVAVTVARDGRIFVVDQLARPLDASGYRSPGAVFAIDPATGVMTLAAVVPRSAGLRDVAVEPGGTLLILDRIADGGTITRVDPLVAPPLNVLASFVLPTVVDAHGLVAEGNGTIAVVDAAADPIDAGTGALLTIDPAFASVTTASSSPLFESPWGVDLMEAESLDAALPNGATIGASLTVTLVGGAFAPDAIVSFGPLVTIDAVRWIDENMLEVDITIPPGTLPQLVDVRVTNPTWVTMAFHCELFELRPFMSCTPASAVGDTLRVAKVDESHLELTWDGTGDPCVATYRMRRAFTPRPAALPGTWPADPAFVDITTTDGDGSQVNERFVHRSAPDPLECFLVTEVGTDGGEGPSDHYGG